MGKSFKEWDAALKQREADGKAGVDDFSLAEQKRKDEHLVDTYIAAHGVEDPAPGETPRSASTDSEYGDGDAFLNAQLDEHAGDSQVNHPPHYNAGKIEVIDKIEDTLGAGFSAYCIGNALKYICRAEHKGQFDRDIKKAIWYLARIVT